MASLGELANANSFRVPATPDLRTRVETFLAAADQIQAALFAVAHIFYPKPKGRSDARANLIGQIEQSAPGRAEFHTAIKSIVDLLHRVREHRNASVHQDGPKALLLQDFHLLPAGEISAPLMEIRHPQFALAEAPVTYYMANTISHLTDASEAMIAWLCAENIKSNADPLFTPHLVPLTKKRSSQPSLS